MSETYTDLLIHIRGRVGESDPYPVEATLSDGSFFVGQATLDHQELLAAESDQEQYGQLLFQALLAGGSIGRAYDLASGIAREASQRRLRVRLWLDRRAGELQTIRWERLQHYHMGGPIPVSITSDTPFSRYTGLGISEPQPTESRPLRMLLAIANPSDLESGYGLKAVDPDKELVNLRPALDALQANKQLKVTILPGQQKLNQKLHAKSIAAGYTIEERMTSLENIQRRLPEYDIFHFIGHGAFRGRHGEESANAALYLEKRDGTCQRVLDEDIVGKLRAQGQMPQLFFLVACESAKTEIGQAFVGLAPRLVEAGVPAVVAMQDKIAITSAQDLTRCFYEQLLKHGIVDRALNEARSTVYDTDDPNWSMPALFMRLRTGQLFTADPIQATLEAMSQYKKFSFYSPDTGRYVPLPIEVVYLTGDQDYSNLAWLEQQASATIESMRAFTEAMTKGPEADEKRPKVLALIGGFGSNKNTQIQRMVWRTICESLDAPAERRLPIYVDLQGYQATRSSLENPLEAAVLTALEQFWPGLKVTKLSALGGQPDLRIFFYGLDEIPDEDRLIVQEQFQALMEEYPHYEYVLSSSATAMPWEKIDQESELHLLILQPLNQTKIRHFLSSLDQIKTLGEASARERRAIGANLLKAINKSQLFDLVAIPRFMFEILRQAHQGRFPTSRTAAIQDWVEEAIVKVAPGQGMRAKATESVYTLAWEMQRTRCLVWSDTDAFQMLDRVRGNRGYDLERLYNNLLREGLLAQVGDRSFRFAYSPVQAYCCAKAIIGRMDTDAERLLNDITSMSAVPDRLNWWEDTLVFVCGLMAVEDQMEPLRRLLDRIVFSSDLLKGNQLFLAARCLLECHQHASKLTTQRTHVVTALKWRTRSTNEPLVPNRILASELLSRLADPQIIIDLAALTYDKARLNLDDLGDYEYSSVRMAAAIGLKRMSSQTAVAHALEKIHRDLATLFNLWSKADVPGLKQLYGAAADLGIRAIVALAMGDIASQSMLSQNAEAEKDALAFLKIAFEADDSTTPLPVRWAVADALAMTDPNWVTTQVVRPAIKNAAGRPNGVQEEWLNRDKCLAYLIGLIRSQEPEAQTFLVEHCLKQVHDTRVWITAIAAIGRLANRDSRQLLQSIAMGAFFGQRLKEYIAKKSDRLHVRRKALEVLADLGDRGSVQALQDAGLDQDEELFETFYWMTNAVYHRVE